ncbi:hypothetical protein [Desulfocurvus sp. DL9XJH121]
MPDFLLENATLILSLGMAVAAISASLLHLQFFRWRRLRRLRDKAGMQFGLERIIIRALERAEAGLTLSQSGLREVRQACGQLGMIGNETERDLARKSQLALTAYMAVVGAEALGESPEQGRTRREALRLARENAGALKRLFMKAAVERADA